MPLWLGHTILVIFFLVTTFLGTWAIRDRWFLLVHDPNLLEEESRLLSPPRRSVAIESDEDGGGPPPTLARTRATRSRRFAG